MTPLLSICVPTYNRAHRLRVMLEAVLPQVAEHADRVELWVSDNASPDQTPQVVEEARRLGPLSYSRNETNLGLVSNVIKATTELARGEFVWVPGDDDLLRPGAVARVVERLEANRGLDLIYLNFRYATVEKHWPESALGGYEGPYVGLANSDLSDRPVERWRELIRAESSMGGQLYVHVVRRSVWQNYWRGRPRQEDFSDSRWTYPHSLMIAETVMNRPSYYVGEPVLTIFNGAQSWWGERHAVLFKFSGVLRAYLKGGLPKERARECERMIFGNCEPLLREMLQGEAGPQAPSLFSYLRDNWRFAEAWRALARAISATGRPRAAYRLWFAAARLRGAFRSALTLLRGAR
jgi:glycosyltransferase involved in cell wall biosynthesis